MYRALDKIKEFKDLERELAKASAPLSVTGCMDSQKTQLALRLYEDYRKVLYVTADEQELSGVNAELATSGVTVSIFPARDLLFSSSDVQGKYLDNQRMETLKLLTGDEKCIVLTTVSALMCRLPSKKVLESSIFKLYEGMVISTENLIRMLTSLGYERMPSVETMGEFAVRGGIIDIYPMTAENPYRIEFFDDEIDTLRRFDAATQRSIDRVSELALYPVRETLGKKNEYVSVLDYLDKDALLILDDPIRLKNRAEAVETEFSESMYERLKSGLIQDDYTKDVFAKYGHAKTEPEKDVSTQDCKPVPDSVTFESISETAEEYTTDDTAENFDDIFSSDSIFERMRYMRTLLIPGLDDSLKDFGARQEFRFHTEAASSYKSSIEMLIQDLMEYQDKGYRISIVTPSRTRASRLAEEFREYGLKAFCPDEGSDEELKPGETEVVTGNFAKGYICPDIKYLMLTESDIFGKTVSRRRRKNFSGGAGKLVSLNDLSVGDYVVHENHGIGIYRGIEHIVRDGVEKDYIKVEYADSGKLYIPATKLDLIQKYASSDAKTPKINKLNASDWTKTRQKVNRSVRDIAKELISLYSARLSAKGYKYGPDTVWQQELEEMFPYEETDDQLNAIKAVKSDMESDRIMDRLICGDVGYGKTEIAIRAAFKAVQESKQAAMLVPTTILCQQHYQTFKERFAKFPVRIGMLSRFRSYEQNKRTIEELKTGKTDIVIGTHRLLSKDVSFKDLGLLIVDEEQRFGVAHKEKIKQLKQNVEALTLTATPIPRTLHMSLTGIRDMSVLDEPPFDRVPIQTYVMEYNDEFVREAINRELARNGQVFYIYNRVKGIEDKCTRIRSLIPSARIEFAHGRMKESELEDIMMDFVNGEIDVLIATTIVETGLDIPNANTLIIDGAENMGLSQLYQLRGRVGRSNRTAYAFFMYKKDKMLSSESEKRLKAIREFTGFGAGIKIAMRDLEIRGAGNVLGAEQHGDMQAVGYDLYCKLLSKAVRIERGIEEKPEFETTADCDIDAFIPAEYISDEHQKLDIYKRISEISSEEDYNDVLDEIIDRFGELPAETAALLKIALLKAKAHAAYATDISVREGSIVMLMYQGAELDVELIPGLIQREDGRLKFINGISPKFVYTAKKNEKKDVKTMIDKAFDIISALIPNS